MPDSALIERYENALRNLPESGGGGCHQALLSAANIGRKAGVSPDEIARDLAAHVHGSREVSETEIAEAVATAFRDDPAAWRRPTLPPRKIDGKKLLDTFLKRGAGFTEDRIRAASPIRIPSDPKLHASLVLQTLYDPTDVLYIGMKNGLHSINIAAEWAARFERRGSLLPHIIPNPLTGQQGLAKNGQKSFRADSCVKRFRFATSEHDQLERQQQVEFWAGSPLPIAALIDSGGKSIHGWVLIDALDADDWTRRVEDELFSYLRPVGIDGSCKNEARLSRIPGHFRAEKQRWQRLLYLNPEGGTIL
ncbi:MAG TPA: hypothetical protein VMD77_05585 [Candidatus Baltobacteraceae bacterium]|nr:hypothetical protein [Candidatus Baltobacteraceae bacterium]